MLLASPQKMNSASTQKMNSTSTQMDSASTQKMDSASSIPLLFTHTEIYTYYKKINKTLPPGMVLMNKAQFLDWWSIKPNPIQLTRNVRNKLRITRKLKSISKALLSNN